MKFTLSDINKALTKMFDECSFNSHIRKPCRRSLVYYLKKELSNFRAELFDLTDAQDFFRDVVRDEI